MVGEPSGSSKGDGGFALISQISIRLARRTHSPCCALIRLWIPLQVVICSPFWMLTPDITRSSCTRKMRRKHHSSLHVVHTVLSACLLDWGLPLQEQSRLVLSHNYTETQKPIWMTFWSRPKIRPPLFRIWRRHLLICARST